MKTIPFLLLVTSLALLGRSPVGAADAPAVLTFDDLSQDVVPGGYGGLNWFNFGVFNGTTQPVTSGYRIGVITPDNIVYNQSGAPVTLSRAAGFTLHSAYLTRALDTRSGIAAMHVRVQGSVGTNITYDNTYTISNAAPALIHFNYLGVDRVEMVASPDSPFAMDNLTVTVPPPDASCTYVASPRNRRHGLGAEAGNITVTTQPGCAWSVSNTNDWVTIHSSLDNSGNGTVTYSVAADSTGAGRNGSIIIAGQEFEVSQAAPPTDDSLLLTFEEVLPGALIPEGYGGLRWENFGILDGTIQPANSGYHVAVVSPDNVAFNRFGSPASIRSDKPFTLKSAYMTAAINIPNYTIQVRVQGFLGATLMHDENLILNNNAPTLIPFNYVGVDEVRFIPSQHSTIFVLDNVTVAAPSDSDSDGDGVLDDEDDCPGTPSGVAVNGHGCGIEQLVPCAGPLSGGPWRNHGAYVSAIASAIATFLTEGIISEEESISILEAAARSDCGKKR